MYKLQSLILRSALPDDFVEAKAEHVLLGGFPNTVTSYPRENIYLDSKWSKGTVKLAVIDKLPVGGVDVVVANDLADRDNVENPGFESRTGEESPVDYVEDRAESPICVVTHSRAQAVDLDNVDINMDVNTVATEVNESSSEINEKVGWERDTLTL